MNKIIKILFLSFFIQASIYAGKPIKLSGHIENVSAPSVIVVNGTSLKIVPDVKQETMKLDSNGNFEIEINTVAEFNWIIVAYNNIRYDFYARQGSVLKMNVDQQKVEQPVQFSGKGSELPNYFIDALRRKSGIMEYYNKMQQLAKLEYPAYKLATDSIKNDELSYLKNYKTEKIPNDFVTYYTHFLDYSVYNAILNYPIMHLMALQQFSNIDAVNKEAFEVVKDVPAKFDDKYLDNPFYQNYLQSYYGVMVRAAGLKNISGPPLAANTSDSMAFRMMNKVTDSILEILPKKMPKQSAAFTAGRIITGESKKWSVTQMEDYVTAYKKNYSGTNYVTEIDTIYNNFKKFMKGSPAVNFAFTTLEGKQMKLSDLKGKVVYLDFWASWCGPCKGEMPFAKKVKEHFKDRQDVVFLYVSIDDKELNWKNGIQALDITGMHTRTSGWTGPIAQLYEVQSVPAYFLIDKKGNFAVDKAPRPSQTEAVIQLIEGLL